MKRKEQKAWTRIRILESARECFADHDVRDVSMNDLAAHAGISVGALYVHFPSREALMGAVFNELQGKLIQGMRETLAQGEATTVPQLIELLAKEYIGSMRRFRPFISLYASHMAQSISADILKSGGSVAPFAQMVSATLVSLTGSIKMQVDLATLSASVVAVWRGAAIAYVGRPVKEEGAVSASLATMTEVLLRGVAPKVLELDGKQLALLMARYLKER